MYVFAVSLKLESGHHATLAIFQTEQAAKLYRWQLATGNLPKISKGCKVETMGDSFYVVDKWLVKDKPAWYRRLGELIKRLFTRQPRQS